VIKRIEAPVPQDWKCGETTENVRCQLLLDGYFAWSFTYRIYIADCGFEPTTPPTPASTKAPSAAPTATPRTDVCFGWGDPHVSTFHDVAQVNGLWNVYDRFYGTIGWETYFRLEKDSGAIFEVQAEHEDINGNGLPFIVYFKVFIDGREVLGFRYQAGTTPTQAILDPAEVTTGASGSVWPTGSGLLLPSSYSFPNWPEIKLFFNYWSNRRVDLGIMFTGPAGVPGRNARASGLCCTSDSCPNRSTRAGRRMLVESNPRASLPIIASPSCPTQESCCARLSQHDVLYKSCLVDALTSCCAIGADEATCCTADVAKCGVDYECEAGQTCTAAGFCVQQEPNMCQGEWSEFSPCSTTCGDGSQQRTYTILSESTNGGPACPAAHNQVETRVCTRGTCGDVCAGVSCVSPPVCMKSDGVCADVSSAFNGVRMHTCLYDPLPSGASCASGVCDGEGNCISNNAVITAKEKESEELFDFVSLAVGALGMFVICSLVFLLICCVSRKRDKELENLWNLKDAASLSMQDVEAKPVTQDVESLRF